ncbi:hypothetical protein COV24_01550 [candidate division WWE3 bacterium CG10_big_fil_rev_8_21_14_0_10_32_10]|uniref:Uncharacterized protein n=1 Tax=candidate division WWE3 bacterium CG10_big_fil_rev_8_21_14_0_10_32_10 TaxID=1975090 RepID=A0A2H0RB80_UNCKA|nr:MAG: hypothetical protein COV24_01550 [candidate division WWE3 bacterium CG10_big_fil_rev_8_21_14_0_10_32_10]
MSNYISFKNKYEGIQEVLGTIKTEEKIAATNIHFLKQRVFNLSSFNTELLAILSRFSYFYPSFNTTLTKNKIGSKNILIIITDDKGLVGSLYHNMITLLLDKKKEYHSVIVIGNKGVNYIKEERIYSDDLVSKPFNITSEIPSSTDIENIISYVLNTYNKKDVKRIDILYPKFISLLQQMPIIVSLLPVNLHLEQKGGSGIPIFEGSKKDFFEWGIKTYLETNLYKIFLEANLSEFSARTVAMEHAKTQADERSLQYLHDYHKTKLKILTQRQLESFSSHKYL